MDLQSFAEEDFDPKKWINKAWSSCGNQGKEAFVSSTVSKLQIYMKQLTNSLDETTTQIVSSVPSILQDASSLQLEGALLQQKLLGLEQKVQGVEEQTGQSIQSLQKIDQLKSRLENAATALREADKWAVQVAALEEILEDGVPTAGEKLVELTELVAAMTLSLEVLSDAPDYESKKFQLETLYNRLEAAVTPPLLDAFTQMDSGRSATYVRIFQSMNRLMSCSRALRRATATRLSRAWRDQSSHCARALHALLCANCGEQVQWFSDVLRSEKPVSEVVRLFTDLLLSVDPSPNKIVSASLKMCSTSEQGVALLTDLRRDIDEFIANVRTVIDSHPKETVEHSTLRQLGRAAYAPLKESMPYFTQILSRQLIDHLNDIQEQSDLTEHSRRLLSIVERSQSWMESGYSSSKMVAGNCAAVFYTPALEAFVSELSTHLSSHARRIETEFLTSVATGKCSGVLAGTFPAALLLENAVSLLLDLLAERQKCDVDDATTEPHPLTDLPSLLLDPASQSRLSVIKSEPLSVISAVRRIKQQLTNLAKTVLMQPLHAQLDKVPILTVWNNNDPITTDLPDFALSPQEYITEIGQYLMTLPQHLEMHLSDKQAPLQFLSEVCNETCNAYAEKILNIKNMDELGTKRCYTDIVYLSSVVEDLGSNVTHSLKSLEKSLRAATPSTPAQGE